MRITNNLAAMRAFNSLSDTNLSLQNVIRALSTGLRINSAADDASGFAVSEKMRSQIRGLDVALRNSQDGISMLQTAEGGLDGINSMLQRMRELAVQASNDSLTSTDRQYVQLEVDELRDQIDRIAETTQFNRKRLLNGSSGALWASSDSSVRALIYGGLEGAEGNYRIEVEADPGQAQVQKSHIYDIMGISNSYSNSSFHEIYINDGIDILGNDSGQGWHFDSVKNTLNFTEDGTYYVVGKLDSSGKSIATNNGIVVNSGVKAKIFFRDVNIETNGYGFYMDGAEVDLYLEGDNQIIGGGGGGHCSAVEVTENSKLNISSIDGDFKTTGTLTAKGTEHGAGIGASCGTRINPSATGNAGEINIWGGTIIAEGGISGAGIGGGSKLGSSGGNCGTINIYGGDVTATGGAGAAGIGSGAPAPRTNTTTTGSITIAAGATVNATGTGGAAGIGGGAGFSIIDTTGATPGTTIRIDNSSSTTVSTTGYIAAGSQNPSDSIGPGSGGNDNLTNVIYQQILPPDARTIPQRPALQLDGDHHQLSDIKQFYNSEGVFLVERPQTITITQGDGKKADVTLYKTDSIYEAAEKINKAIADTLGQARYTDNRDKFCTISDGTAQTSESIYDSEPIYDSKGILIGHNIHATMLVRSAVAGKAGELSFSGNDEILRALGLNTIQESSETKFTSSVYDAHSGRTIASGVKTTGNILHGVLTGADIEFDAMAGTSAKWDEATKRFVISSGEKYEAFVHLSDRTTAFQTGANRGEDFTVNLGDMSSHSLGITGVNLASRETAARSIGTIDRAVNYVSTQRARIGSYINGLEHTMENLTTTSANLTAAESRIRDADMSKMMMEFVKLQILNQSGTSMLAQANQLPQSVMSLMQ